MFEFEIPTGEEKQNNGVKDGKRRELDSMPCDHGFWLGEDNYQLCHATGYEESRGGEWWIEYVDSDGDFHYGR